MADMTKNKMQEILIEFVGGPLDGDIGRMIAPFKPIYKETSKFRADVQYVYEFDEKPGNTSLPLLFKFRGYEKI